MRAARRSLQLRLQQAAGGADLRRNEGDHRGGPRIRSRCNIQRYGKVIEVMEGDGAGCVYECLSADDKRAHGLSPSFWVFDEFAQAPNSDLLDNLRTAMGKRSESLGVIITRKRPTISIRSRR